MVESEQQGNLTPSDEAKLVALYHEMKEMHCELEGLGTRKVRLAHKAFDLQVIYTGLVERKIRFMERDGIGTEEVRLREDFEDPQAVERHIFAHPIADPDKCEAWAATSDSNTEKAASANKEEPIVIIATGSADKACYEDAVEEVKE